MNGKREARNSMTTMRSVATRPATVPAARNIPAMESIFWIPPSATQRASAMATEDHASTVNRSRPKRRFEVCRPYRRRSVRGATRMSGVAACWVRAACVVDMSTTVGTALLAR